RDLWDQYIFFVSMYGVKRKNRYSSCYIGFRGVNSIFVWGKFSLINNEQKEFNNGRVGKIKPENLTL
nr:hypothetical protein [Xenococcaceae cyanobacterium MO_167.B52]